ncbi:CRISPR-associated protein Csx16 [Neisseria sicca]|jgi:putative CRISPR-associated protein, VVA1548 family|uniref:CRISPR-associated protein Csx16 n=1 Tax=Neisseria sicca TaxID=490 RepID=A0A2I1XAH7_NEISI|nr:CRISPR-associated protein Csx16 [Neisseria sicca]MBY6283263.1 CRISPR-associated protein Csx16 [Neisseria flava]PLA39605.1 CRISPR-associated protein Csx16 [Neisseria sicca]QTM24143.1 CRISPR-associated protein Csx16 [Neisseria sicca]
MIYFVSRHQGAVEWIQHQTEWKVDCFLPHLDTVKIEAGDVVLGTLPLHLAAEVCKKGAAFYFLQLPQKLQLRGSEYSVDEMNGMGACLRRFDVRAWD